MARNYDKEGKWQKEKYDEIRAKISKKLGTDLRTKLKSEGKTIASWIRENAKKYLKES